MTPQKTRKGRIEVMFPQRQALRSTPSQTQGVAPSAAMCTQTGTHGLMTASPGSSEARVPGVDKKGAPCHRWCRRGIVGEICMEVWSWERSWDMGRVLHQWRYIAGEIIWIWRCLWDFPGDVSLQEGMSASFQVRLINGCFLQRKAPCFAKFADISLLSLF